MQKSDSNHIQNWQEILHHYMVDFSEWLLNLEMFEVLLLLIFFALLFSAYLGWMRLRIQAGQLVILSELQHFLLEELAGSYASRKDHEYLLEQIACQSDHLRGIIEILKKDNDYGN